MHILAVASEAFPLIKTGGLADVVGALPGALAPQGLRVTTMLPGYPAVLAALPNARSARNIADLFGGPARLLRGEAAGLDIIAVDAPHLFGRAGSPYLMPDGREWPDNALRFAALGAAAALVAQDGLRGARFSAVHAHDWQAGMAAAYLRHGTTRVPCLFTIHNLAFQGKFEASVFPRLGLPWEAFAAQGLEYYGGVGFLKAGLWYADAISTVSPSYAAEIRTSADGMGLDGLLRGRGAALHGILNGIDLAEWNPATDTQLAARFDAADPAPRAANKAALQRALGLAEDPAAPLIAYVGRLAWQKGVDLMLEAIPAIFDAGAQLAILGAGEAQLAERCAGAAAANPGRIGTRIGFDEGLARLIYGGADAVLVPSRFEPCGLAQLCALRYGALPIVARVGGLADTVVDANTAALSQGWGTGFACAPGSVALLAEAITRAAFAFREPSIWRALQANAMRADVSWAPSAARYAAVLRGLVHG
jgi:starch synthase